MPRTDVHRPAALVTEDYEFAFAYDAHPDAPSPAPLFAPLLTDGWHFGENGSAGGCYHCGQSIRYVAVLRHLPTHTLVKVGEQCLDNRFALASDEFHRLRKAAQLDRERQRVKRTRAVWFATDQDREIAFGWARYMVEEEGAYGYEGMRHGFVSKVNREGKASDRFVRAIMRDMARTERREAERAIQDAKRTPAVEGNGIAITGEVVSTKWQDNDFGGRLVMTVKDDRGFLVWGSVPKGLDPERGSRVSFVANVERSDRDEFFGFFKRPRRAQEA